VATAGLSECQQCSIGSYQSLPGQSSCLLCEGALEHTWEWVAASQVFVLKEGATSRAQCGCQRGYRRDGGVCVECNVGENEGLDCPGGADDRLVTLRKGYFSLSQISVFRCWGDEYRCPGSRRPGDACADGRRGLTCALCVDGKVPAAGGKCERCRAGSSIIFPIAIVVFIAVLAVIYLAIDQHNAVVQSSSLLSAALACSLFISIVQQMGVISIISVAWVDPVKSMLKILRLLAFDIEVLQLGCVANVPPTTIFLGKVLTIGFGILVMVAIHVLVVICLYSGQFWERRSSLYGSVGTVTSVFFISVVAVTMSPFQCQEHPNGQWTSRVYPSVRCWSSSDHGFMVTIGSVAVLVPLAYLGLVTLLVFMYPAKVRNGDATFLKSFTFLFFRFQPSAHWYIVVHMVRSLVLAVLPVIPHVITTLYFMQITVVLIILVTVRWMPWRAATANFLDIFCSMAVLTLLITAGFFVPTITDADRQAMAWFASLVVSVACAAFPPVLGQGLYQRFRRRDKPFQFFLCHHKVGSGAFVRLLKMTLDRHPSTTGQVFIDSDHLESLDELFRHVREETEELVVIATRELFLRPWCVGEIVTTHMTHRRTFLVRMPDYQVPDDDLIINYRSNSEASVLLERGITQEMIAAALQWARMLPCITFPSSVSEEVTLDLAELLVKKRRLGELKWRESPWRATEVCICVDHANNEAISAALCLQKMLLPMLALANSDLLPWILPEATAVGFPALTNLARGSRSVVLLCTTGCLESPSFLETISGMATTSPPTMPAVAEEAFRFPAKAQIMALRDRLPSGADPGMVLSFIEGIFTKIATKFHANCASEMVLRTAVQDIVRRVVGLAKKANPSTAWIIRKSITSARSSHSAEDSGSYDHYTPTGAMSSSRRGDVSGDNPESTDAEEPEGLFSEQETLAGMATAHAGHSSDTGMLSILPNPLSL